MENDVCIGVPFGVDDLSAQIFNLVLDYVDEINNHLENEKDIRSKELREQILLLTLRTLNVSTGELLQ